MIEVTSAESDEIMYVNPAHIAAIHRPPGKEWTEVVLAIAGPKDMGPMWYKVRETPEVVWQKCVQEKNNLHEKVMRDMYTVMHSVNS